MKKYLIILLLALSIFLSFSPVVADGEWQDRLYLAQSFRDPDFGAPGFERPPLRDPTFGDREVPDPGPSGNLPRIDTDGNIRVTIDGDSRRIK